MNKQKILKFIQENRDTIKSAPVEQKIRLLKLIRESLETATAQGGEISQESPPNSDYLEER